MELGARIGTMTANGGGIDYAAEIRKLWDNEVGAVIDLTGFYASEQTWYTSRVNLGQVFRYSKAEEIIAPWCVANAANMFGDSSTLKRVTISRFSNNAYLFDRTSTLQEITVVSLNAAAALSVSPAAWSGLSTKHPDVIIHCTDADVKYIDGEWTIVQRDSTNGGGYNRQCVRRSYRRSSRPSARFYARTSAWEVAA